MKNRNKIFYLIITIISMSISIYFVLRLESKIEKLEYTLDNSNLESNIAIMVLDLDTQEYLKAQEIPRGKYILNIEKTHCIGRGGVSNYDNKNGTINFETEAADECYIYFDAYSGAYDKIITEFTGQGMTVGNGTLYLRDSTLANSANDGSYRYAGADPDNYVCFAGDTCDDNHKYRIIGIFGENLKIIKMTSMGNKSWNTSGVNTWENSTMDTYLNGEWLTSFGHSDLIEEYEWHVGGYSSSSVTSKTMRDAELSSTPIVSRKVGLMYVSDYGYGASNSYWTTMVNSYNGAPKNTDWLFLNNMSYEWTITRISGNSRFAYFVYSPGNIGSGNGVDGVAAFRPSFYLKKNVEIKSGSGTKTDPWIMGI